MANPNSTCTEPGCERKTLARKMCSTHYSYWHRENNGRKDATLNKNCIRCLSPFNTTTKRVVYCSLGCAQKDRARALGNAGIVVRPNPKVWAGQHIPSRQGAALVAGPCRHCGTHYVGAPGSVYCSNVCGQRASWHRRYKRYGEFSVTTAERQAIYARDNLTCQICMEAVDITLDHTHSMGPTLDHIIPQSWMLIPDHSEGNLRLAHRLCNSTRGASAA